VTVLARIVRAREALEDGDVVFAAAILFDLEEDLAGDVAHVYTSKSLASPRCPTSFRWPGELDHHLRFVHFAEAA
jgi:hypothetical protein